jgi:EpsI family protein
MSSWIRSLFVATLLAAAGLFLHVRSRAEVLPPREALTSFPQQVGEWVGQDVGIPPKVLEVLGPGEFLERTYSRSSEEPIVDLFLAYFPSQRTGDTIHTPKNCLPGAGWTPIESSRMLLGRPGGSPITVNRYVIAKGSDRLLVLYWYQAHGRVVASEYWAKYYLVADAIRMNRTDGALIRVITPVASGEGSQRAEQRALRFTQGIVPLLDDYIPR